ncbi:hypothetical protein [Flavobacterium cheniae]|jgi:hypothetical protein|uniref:DUF1735 domain-containing protein n=1 Tax=Flavobacterium cheniae TaxID=295428 RepID=A0A562KA83_9FLAO|nr:hypothetical protein [Flavobacterium cheniae]TDR24664.1 hypothetical protein C8D80_1706 [Flavobacterium cheniae]TWH92307.1 hypothetical protein IP97_02462 [Flavobacterium cheniae]
MKKFVVLFSLIVGAFAFFSCEDSDDVSEEPHLIVKFQFDPNQVRLNNLGQPATIPSGHAAQSPDFRKISAHYFELAPTAYTQLTEGTVLYHADETTQGGSVAIDFSKAVVVGEGEAFLRIPLSQVAQGNYEYVRVSLAYQEYNISIRNNGADYQGKLASFVGYNNYITTHSIGNNSFPVNGNRLQGYWAFALNDFPYATSGQAPAGATTVPNPIAATSPIPSGSCVVTGKFAQNLIINGNETRDVVITLSLSSNNSFEWQEVTSDGKYEPSIGENVVDMGLRGLIPTYVK